jgi:phosphate transport system protein
MARQSFEERLEALRGNVAAMADVALERQEASIEVLESGDCRRAQEIIERDEELNEWYLDIESECIELLARHQPLASDLRFVASSFKIVTDIERIGDLATNLAEYGQQTGGTLLVDITPIATTATEMVADAMDAYLRDDPELARDVAERDGDLDAMCKSASETVVRSLITENPDPTDTLEAVSWSLLTIRDLERVGDHAVNICARTLYMLEMDDELIY